MRRHEQSAFTAAGYVVFCAGVDCGTHEKENHGVGLAVREYRGRDGYGGRRGWVIQSWIDKGSHPTQR